MGELVISSGGAAGVEKSASTGRGTVRPDNVPAEVLEHAAGHDNALKCGLGRAGGDPATVLGVSVGDDSAHYCTQARTGGHGLRTLCPWIVRKWRLGYRQRPRAPLAGRGARVPAVQHEGGLAIRGDQGGVAGQKELARVFVPPGDIDGLAGVHV